MSKIFLSVLLMGVGGCVAAPGILPISDAYSRFNPGLAERYKLCDTAYRRSPTSTSIDRANCQNTAINDTFGRRGYPNMDILDDYELKNVAVARKIDAGELTEAQASSLMNMYADQAAESINDRAVSLLSRLSCFNFEAEDTSMDRLGVQSTRASAPCKELNKR